MSQPTKSEYEKLRAAVAALETQLEVSRKEIEFIRESTRELQKLETQSALLKQRLEDQQKQIDKWDTRVWGLVLILIGAILSLASGLIVALTRKSP